MIFAYCPRCGEKTYEYLRSHSYCVGCNYSPTTDEKYDYTIPEWALEVLREGGLLDESVLLPSETRRPTIGFVSKGEVQASMKEDSQMSPDPYSEGTLSEAI